MVHSYILSVTSHLKFYNGFVHLLSVCIVLVGAPNHVSVMTCTDSGLSFYPLEALLGMFFINATHSW
jgi:hypothetical protein